MNMKKFIPILAGLAMLATAAQAEGTKIHFSENSGDDPRVLFLNGDGDGPSFISLHRFMAQRGYLGVGLTDLTPELRVHLGVDGDYGVLVNRVEEDSPAAEAGLQVGDIITLVDGEEISGSNELALAVRRKEEGDPIDLEVWRDGRPTTLTATAAQRQKVQIDLSGLEGLRGLGALGNMEAFGIDVDTINESVEEALKNMEHAFGEDGNFRFNFSPEIAKKLHGQWNLKFDGTTFPQKMEALELIEGQMAERMRELERRLEELEVQLEEEER